MKNERILSYKMSQRLTIEDLQDVSAAVSWTNYITANGSYVSGRGFDAGADTTLDF